MSSFWFQKQTLMGFLNNQESLLYLVLPFLLIFTVFLLKWHRPISKNHPPSPPKLPIIGNLHQLGQLPHRSLVPLADKYGSIMMLHLGSIPMLVVSSVDAAQEVLKTHELAFSNRPQTRSAGILLSNFKDLTSTHYGEYWRKARSICLNHLLNKKMVQSFKSLREEEIALMMERITRSACDSSSVIDVRQVFGSLTYDVISRAAIGRRCTASLKELLEAVAKVVSDFHFGDFIPWLGWIDRINGSEAKVKKVAKKLNEYLDNVIDDEISKTKTRESSNINGINVEEGKQQQNFLSAALDQLQKVDDANGFVMDRDSIKAIITDFIGAAGDTTLLVLEWAMAELVRHPKVMEKLQKEVREVADHGCKSAGILMEDDLEKLPYLKAVIKETFRLHPPTPLLPRESRMNVNLMGYDIPAGTQVVINNWKIGRDPSLWDDPADKFIPERFLINSCTIDFKGHHFQLLPFGSGRRICAGYPFAMLIVELALANVFCKFNFALPDGARAEDLDLNEAPGLVGHKKIPLLLVASVCTTTP